MASLPDRLRARWEAGGWTRPGDRVVVACSGGVDSVALLHLLRFPLAGLGVALEAAHFDHAMRPGSEGDALWVRGLARSWEVRFHLERAPVPPGNEGEARRLRYRFLERVRREREARWVLTAHHADDQVETILFRILRGTGVGGLRGIPPTREPGILRPLLPFGRDALEAYARTAGIPRRDDPSNLSRSWARNRIRLDVLPVLEDIHPGARKGVLRLARNAARTLAALDRLLDPLADEVVLEREEGRLVLDREALRRHEPSIRRALIRRLVREVGPTPGEAGTGRALSFITSGMSGGRLELPGGVTLHRDFQRIRVEGEGKGWSHDEGEGDGEPLEVSGPEAGEGELRLAGRHFRARWGPGTGPGPGAEVDAGTEVGTKAGTGAGPDVHSGGPGGAGTEVPVWSASFDPGALRFPLILRGWRPGDRTRTPGGTKKLKKVFGELRIPVGDRRRLPLLVDGTGEVLWVAGHHRAPGAVRGPGGTSWTIGVERVEPS